MTDITTATAMENLLGEARRSQREMLSEVQTAEASGDQHASGQRTFLDHMREGVEDVNGLQRQADGMAVDLATGKSGNIHETMLAATHAELSFNFLVQLRNKGLEAYQEIMRMPV